MTNHYHILIETPEANLKQGRYKAILVEKESYLLELTRYIVLNPVRAKMVYFAKELMMSDYKDEELFGNQFNLFDF